MNTNFIIRFHIYIIKHDCGAQEILGQFSEQSIYTKENDSRYHRLLNIIMSISTIVMSYTFSPDKLKF